ncbi:MAG: hypothetical protein AABX17_00570 [Nanoarchaeota archaeon]
MVNEKMTKKRQEIVILSLIIFIACIFFINGVYAADSALNASLNEAKAVDCIRISKEIMQTMTDEGFNVLSIKDNIKQAELTFTAQTLLKEKKSAYDFSSVMPYCDAITKIREDALSAKDEANSLMMFYNDSVIPGMDTTTIDVMINEVNEAISTERYTEVSALVEKAYSEITTVRASYTALNVFYASTARGLMAFLTAKNRVLQITNWQFLLGLVVLILILLLVYRVQIRKMRLNKKLNQLMNRKKTIKELIMKTQKDYFQYGTIPEGEYNIKTKRFAELIRDIDRQIPLLQEEIAKISGGASRIGSLFKEDADGALANNKEVRKEKREEVRIRSKIIAHKSVHKHITHKVIAHKKLEKLKHKT